MTKRCCLSIQLVTGLLSFQSRAATSWDIDNSHATNSVSQGTVEAGQDGKNGNLAKSLFLSKLDLEEVVWREGVGTARNSALSSAVSSRSGSVPEPVCLKNYDVLSVTPVFRVCKSSDLIDGAGVSATEWCGQSTSIGKIALGIENTKQADKGNLARRGTVSFKEDFKRFLGSGNTKGIRSGSQGDWGAFKVAAFGSPVVTR